MRNPNKYEIMKVFRKAGVPFEYNEDMNITFHGFTVIYGRGDINFCMPWDMQHTADKFWGTIGFEQSVAELTNGNRYLPSIRATLTPKNFYKRAMEIGKLIDQIKDMFYKSYDMWSLAIDRKQDVVRALNEHGITVEKRPVTWRIKGRNVMVDSYYLDEIATVTLDINDKTTSQELISIGFELVVIRSILRGGGKDA